MKLPSLAEEIAKILALLDAGIVSEVVANTSSDDAVADQEHHEQHEPVSYEIKASPPGWRRPSDASSLPIGAWSSHAAAVSGRCMAKEAGGGAPPCEDSELVIGWWRRSGPTSIFSKTFSSGTIEPMGSSSTGALEPARCQ